jgi:antitoxin component of MazEF toxin-antitoxin module
MSQVFKAKLRKIGNSYGILIPAEIIEELHVEKGDELVISVATTDLDERNRLLEEIAGVYKGKGPFVREKEDRY